MTDIKQTIYYRKHEIILTSWVNKYDGCLVINYTIDGIGYPYPHRSKEAAIAKAKQIIDRNYTEGGKGMSLEGKLLFDLINGINEAYVAGLHAGQALHPKHCEICGSPLALASETICSKYDMENDERRWARITNPNQSLVPNLSDSCG